VRTWWYARKVFSVRGGGEWGEEGVRGDVGEVEGDRLAARPEVLPFILIVLSRHIHSVC
jgi:hypothetical protein